MSAAFTPGPWRTAPYGSGKHEATVQVVNGCGTAQICGPANNPDAALIAAAPDLYAALDRIASMTDVETDFDGFEAREIASAAIRKARGETL